MKVSTAVFTIFAFATLPHVDGFAITAAISAAASAVIAGSSLAGTTMNALMHTGLGVTCGIEIENWTKFPFTNPIVRIEGGQVSTPPHTVLPSRREAMIAHKWPHANEGSWGTVSWLIEGTNRRVVIMWSTPINFGRFSNWLAVGITREGNVHHSGDLFSTMYYSEPCWIGSSCSRAEYRMILTSIMKSDDKIEVVGIMGSSHQAKVHITVRPVNQTDFSVPIKILLGHANHTC